MEQLNYVSHGQVVCQIVSLEVKTMCRYSQSINQHNNDSLDITSVEQYLVVEYICLEKNSLVFNRGLVRKCSIIIINYQIIIIVSYMDYTTR